MSSGAVVGPLAFGVLVGAGSFTAAWTLGAASLLTAAVLVLVARNVMGREAGVAPEVRTQ